MERKRRKTANPNTQCGSDVSEKYLLERSKNPMSSFGEISTVCWQGMSHAISSRPAFEVLCDAGTCEAIDVMMESLLSTKFGMDGGYSSNPCSLAYVKARSK